MKLKTIEALLIDPSSRTAISEISIVIGSDGGLRQMQELVGGPIERVAFPMNGDQLFVNEEFLIQANPKFGGKFEFDAGFNTSLMDRVGKKLKVEILGRGVLVGAGTNGNIGDVKTTLLDAGRIITITEGKTANESHK